MTIETDKNFTDQEEIQLGKSSDKLMAKIGFSFLAEFFLKDLSDSSKVLKTVRVYIHPSENIMVNGSGDVFPDNTRLVLTYDYQNSWLFWARVTHIRDEETEILGDVIPVTFLSQK